MPSGASIMKGKQCRCGGKRSLVQILAWIHTGYNLLRVHFLTCPIIAIVIYFCAIKPTPNCMLKTTFTFLKKPQYGQVREGQLLSVPLSVSWRQLAGWGWSHVIHPPVCHLGWDDSVSNGCWGSSGISLYLYVVSPCGLPSLWLLGNHVSYRLAQSSQGLCPRESQMKLRLL